MYCERYPETIGLQDRSGRTPFILASMHGRDSQLEVFLNGLSEMTLQKVFIGSWRRCGSNR